MSFVTLTKAQNAFADPSNQHIIWGAGRGAGKTFAMAMAVSGLATDADFYGVVVFPDSSRMGHFVDQLKAFNPLINYSQGQKLITYPWGARLYLISGLSMHVGHLNYAHNFIGVDGMQEFTTRERDYVYEAIYRSPYAIARIIYDHGDEWSTQIPKPGRS